MLIAIAMNLNILDLIFDLKFDRRNQSNLYLQVGPTIVRKCLKNRSIEME